MAMSKSLASISRRLCQNFLSNQKPFCYQYHHHLPKTLFSTTTNPSAPEANTELHDSSSTSNSDTESTPTESTPQRRVTDSILEGGLDVGIYKAIIVGQVGQSPLQKRLKNGRMVTLTTVGTGGIRNERIPFSNEEPREYADRCNVQWHRVAIYPERLSDIVMKHAHPGVILYLEGNLETKIFTDNITGLVRHVKEIAVRQNGRIVFLGNSGGFNEPSPAELKGIGYF